MLFSWQLYRLIWKWKRITFLGTAAVSEDSFLLSSLYRILLWPMFDCSFKFIYQEKESDLAFTLFAETPLSQNKIKVSHSQVAIAAVGASDTLYLGHYIHYMKTLRSHQHCMIVMLLNDFVQELNLSTIVMIMFLPCVPLFLAMVQCRP